MVSGLPILLIDDARLRAKSNFGSGPRYRGLVSGWAERWEICIVHAVSHRTAVSLVLQCEWIYIVFRSRQHRTVTTALMPPLCTGYNTGGSESN